MARTEGNFLTDFLVTMEFENGTSAKRLRNNGNVMVETRHNYRIPPSTTDYRRPIFPHRRPLFICRRPILMCGKATWKMGWQTTADHILLTADQCTWWESYLEDCKLPQT